MLIQEEDVEINALRKRGWTISEIASHAGRDRKIIRLYSAGDRNLGVRENSEPDPFGRDRFVRMSPSTLLVRHWR